MIKERIRRMEDLVNRLAAALRQQAAPLPRQLQTAQDVIDLLQEQVEALRAETQAGAVQKARAVGYLAELARKAIETGSLAARLDALEGKRTGTIENDVRKTKGGHDESSSSPNRAAGANGSRRGSDQLG